MLLRVFFWLGGALSLAWCCFAKSFWLLLPLWALLFAAITCLAIFYLFIISLFCYGKKPFEKDNTFLRPLAYHTMDCILEFFRFRVHGEGIEKIPAEPCVLVCNHLSRFDPMVTFVLMKGRRLGFLSKKENMRIPIAGPIIQKIGFLPLDRENPIRAMRTIHQGAKLISTQDFTMGIYPEGTRSFDGKLLEFKTGAFVMAKRAACPMVICKICGTNAYHGRFPFRRTDTTFSVLEVVSAEQVKSMKPEELSDYARGVIEKNLNEHKHK